MKVSDLLPGDVLLFRPTTWLGRLVAWATGSEYCHAAMFLGGTSGKTVAEMREFTGGRIVPIAIYATEAIDVFRADDADFEIRLDAILTMYRILGSPYSFWHGIAAWLLRRLPEFVRSKECDHHGYHCSQAISKAYRVAMFDLRPDLSDWATTPGDLAASQRLRLIGRLEF